jgi:predicted nucleic acid-binding protein
MSSYADSSFLVKLYLREPETPAALAAITTAERPLAFIALHRLELTNAIRRCAASGKVTKRQGLRAFQSLRRDLRTGFYAKKRVHWDSIFIRALRLSRKHADTLHVRSLDLLHVASALEIRATEFLSFDDRQRRTALAEGLTVLP